MLGKINTDQFKTHRPVDNSDPGFTIAGWELRWLGKAVSETRVGRPWSAIRKQHLPKEVVEHIQATRPTTFLDDGMYRRGDLVLAAAPKEIAEQYRKEKQQLAKAALEKIHAPVRTRQGSSQISVEESKVTNQRETMQRIFQDVKHN